MAEVIRDRAELQDWLVHRVARDLKIAPIEVDPHSRITTLGIDSLAMIGLAGELAELTGQELRAEILWECETIAAVAAHLTRGICSTDGKTSSRQTSQSTPTTKTSLSMLREGEGRHPVIVVGSMTIAAQVKKMLPEYVPVGWLQLDALYRDPKQIRTVPQMAAAYAEDVVRQFPAGRLTILGFSYTGLVAFDLACRLVDQQREVRLLLLEPARFDQRPLRERWSSWAIRHFRALYTPTWKERRCYVRDRLRERLRIVHDHFQVRLFRQRLVARRQAGESMPSRLNWMLVEPGLMASLRGYRPPVLNSSAVIAARPEWLAEHTILWTRQIKRSLLTVSLVNVPDHQSVTQEVAARIWMPVIHDWHTDDRFELDASDSGFIRPCLSPVGK